uniref:Odorant receptor n=1 Tax=Lutzomyia longipalpis TaxID=7200 RepID=A0A3F2ZDC7_LUTLO
MLEDNHKRLKNFIFMYYNIWRCEFIPDFGWKFIKWIKTSIYPVNLLYGVFCMIWHFFIQMEDYGYDLALTIVYFFGVYQCFVVYYELMINHRKDIFELLHFFDGFLRSDDLMISGLRRKHLRINTNLAIKWTRIFVIFISFVGISVTIFHLFITDFSAPMLFTIPGLSKDNIFFYPANIFYGTFLYFSILSNITTADAVIMITVLYFKSEFNFLTDFVAQLDDYKVAKVKAEYILRVTHENHRVTLMKIKELTQFLWHLYFHKLFAIMIYLCCTLYIFQSLNSSLFIAVLIVGAMTSQIFILCFFGQVIENCSELLYNQFYMTKWYEMKPSEQRIFLLMMMSLQKPLRISTFGFGNISIYTFVQICKAAGSYAAILYTVLN